MKRNVFMFTRVTKFKMIKNRLCVSIITFVLMLNLSILYSYPQTSTKPDLQKEKEPGIKEYSLEFLGATVGEFVIGIPICLLIAYSVPWPSDAHEGPAVASCLGGYCLGSIVGAPLGTIAIGKLMRQRGSRLGAFAGGLLGTGLGLFTVWQYNQATLNKQQNHWPQVILTALVLPPLCSVIGYNLFRCKSDSHSSTQHCDILPAFTLQLIPDYKKSIKFGINIKF